jgi:serine/threonine protein kinase
LSAQPPDDDRTIDPQNPGEPAARNEGGHNTLPVGTRLGEFEIRGLVGEGGFGIVYFAYDHSLERNIALKEYMPSSLAQRADGLTVSVRSARHAQTFALGLRSFVNEARLLAQFDHPSLVKVYRFWEANGTAYMAMPYYEGLTLKQTLKSLGHAPDEAWLTRLLTQLLDALEIIHSRQCYHRDIAPDNVLMVGGDTPVLLDFGAARRVLTDQTQALTVILKPGYAPVEQYGELPNLKQGPWTDLYALASVMFFAITGNPPAQAVARIVVDPVRPLAQTAAGSYSDVFLAARDAAMAVKPEDRPQSIAEFREALGFGGPVRDQPALRTGAPGMTGSAARPQTAARAESVPRTTAPTTASTSAPATVMPGLGETGDIERLLARYIGPMAKIIARRARAEAPDDEGLLRRVAEAIDDAGDRAEFLAAARRLKSR